MMDCDRIRSSTAGDTDEDGQKTEPHSTAMVLRSVWLECFTSASGFIGLLQEATEGMGTTIDCDVARRVSTDDGLLYHRDGVRLGLLLEITEGGADGTPLGSDGKTVVGTDDGLLGQ